MIGTSIGRYQILAELGRGGMGEVFRATDTKLGRAVALKVLPPEMARDADRLARFQREARAIAALNHPHIVTIHSVDEIDGIHFLTMELIDGESLAQLIPHDGLAVDRTLAIGTALADALAAAHDKGIVHRDLKPGNVMMTNDGRVKVLDFGLAKEFRSADPTDATLAGGRTEIGVVLGTPAYMSPEQVAGRPMDHRTDIFSLGIVLYQMASGQRPFDGSTSIELASAILRDAPRPLSEIRSDVPADLERLIRRCLEKDVLRRVQTARDVGNELREIARAAPRPRMASARAAASERENVRFEDEGFWVAVSPFKYSGGNPDVAALAEGLSEEIVTGLSRFSYLKVLARAADQTVTARYVISGSLRQSGSQLRLAVQLVDTISGAHLWAETYDRPFRAEDVFPLQDDLVPRIVSTVADWYGVLPQSMSEVLRLKPADQLTPYEAVLRSFGYGERRTPEEHATARTVLERAVQQAPAYADGWALLSIMCTEEYATGFNLQPDPLGRALHAARQAADAAPSNALAHIALARARFFRKEFQAFRTAADRAIALNPLDGGSLASMGLLMAYSGEWEHGCAMVERAAQRNPHHPGWYWFPFFYNAYRKGDYHGALSIALKINLPHFFYTHLVIAATYGQLAEHAAAHEALRDLLVLKPDIVLIARDALARWYPPDLVEQLIDGLRKAGLDIAPSSAGAGSPSMAVRTDTSTRAMTTPSIAVLPFSNLSADKDQDYFSDGLAEDLINLLAQMSGLKVIARTSAFAFKDQQTDIRTIADALGVANILEGSVRRSGNRIRVTAQLVTAADGSHLWSERYDRQLADVFDVQDEIAAAIAAALRVALAPRVDGAPRHTPSIPAYEALLTARHFHWQVRGDSMARAREFYERAIALDPQYALAHTLYADYLFGRTTVGMSPMREVTPLIRAAALRALELDPDLRDAHAPLALVAATHDYDWAEAARRFAFSTSGGVISPVSRMGFGWAYFLSSGRRHEAVAQLERAVQGDPLHSTHRAMLALGLGALHRYADAEALLIKGLELDPGFFWTSAILADLYVARGMMAQALPVAKQASTLAPWYAPSVGVYAGALVRNGDRAGGRDVVRSFGSPESYGVSIGWALFHTTCGELDAAAEWFARAIEERYSMVGAFLQSAIGEPLRQSPHWPRLAQLMNLPV